MIQLLKNMSLKRYFDNDLKIMNIMKNRKHKKHSFVQLKRNNQVVNNLVKNSQIHERFKHIDVVYHHIRNLTKKNQIQLDYILSFEMIANNLTKSLSRKKFKTFVTQLEMQKSKSNES